MAPCLKINKKVLSSEIYRNKHLSINQKLKDMSSVMNALQISIMLVSMYSQHLCMTFLHSSKGKHTGVCWMIVSLSVTMYYVPLFCKYTIKYLLHSVHDGVTHINSQLPKFSHNIWSMSRNTQAICDRQNQAIFSHTNILRGEENWVSSRWRSPGPTRF